MMLSANFPVIYRGGKLHLTPIWDVLAQQHSTEALVGLFMRFEQAAQQLQIQSVLPAPLKAIPLEVRQLHLMRFMGNDPDQSMHDPSGLTPLLALDAIQESGGIQPLSLSTGDLKPLGVTEELRKKVSTAIVAAIRASTIGQRIQPAQVAYMIDTNFDSLCDGARFDFRPVNAALREIGEVSDADVYGIVVRLQDALEDSQIELIYDKLNLDAETMAAIEDRARRISRVSDPRVPAMNTPRPGPVPKRDTPPKEMQAVAGETSKEAKLRRLGLGKGSKYWQRVRVAVLVTAMIGLGVFGYLNRPSRPLSVDKYDAVLPLKQAILIDGTFQGVLDEARWNKLSRADQLLAVDALTELLKDQDIVADTQIRDSRDSVVIASRGNVLIASPVILKRGERAPQPKEQAENR